MTTTMIESKRMEIEVGGKPVIIETGKYAKSATSSVTVTCGETMLFVHAVVSPEPRVGIDFFPLLIDYEERMSAIGRIPGGYTKTEGRPSEKAVLISRLIDRPIRPLFPKGYRNDIQIVAQLFSYDQEHQPDTLAMLGASTALMLTGAPFEGPIGAVRVGKIDGQLIANPTHQQSDKSDLDIVVAGTAESVIMVEAGCNFVTEDEIMEAVEFAQVEIRKQVEAQLQFAKDCGVERQEFVNPYDTSELASIIKDTAYDMVYDAYHNFDRDYRKAKLDEAKNLVKEKIEALPEDHPIKTMIEETGIDFISEEFKYLEKKIMRAMIINEGIGTKPIQVYKSLINLKFLFSIICVILLLIIWISFDTNIFAGLSMIAEYDDDDYQYAYKIILSSLIIFTVLLFFDLVVQVCGITYNFYKLNVINLSLKIFETFLLALFFLDAWHYLNLFFILGITQLPCFIFEIYSLIDARFSTFTKYNIIRNKEVKSRS